MIFTIFKTFIFLSLSKKNKKQLNITNSLNVNAIENKMLITKLLF